MSQEVELSAVARRRCDSQICGCGPQGSRSIPAGSGQICRRNLEEVGLKLLLRVLLSVHSAVFANDRGIVVRGIASRVSEVAPIGSTKGHINVQDCNSGSVEVLVKHSFKLGVQQLRTLVPTRATPTRKLSTDTCKVQMSITYGSNDPPWNSTTEKGVLGLCC